MSAKGPSIKDIAPFAPSFLLLPEIVSGLMNFWGDVFLSFQPTTPTPTPLSICNSFYSPFCQELCKIHSTCFHFSKKLIHKMFIMVLNDFYSSSAWPFCNLAKFQDGIGQVCVKGTLGFFSISIAQHFFQLTLQCYYPLSTSKG